MGDFSIDESSSVEESRKKLVSHLLPIILENTLIVVYMYYLYLVTLWSDFSVSRCDFSIDESTSIKDDRRQYISHRL